MKTEKTDVEPLAPAICSALADLLVFAKQAATSPGMDSHALWYEVTDRAAKLATKEMIVALREAANPWYSMDAAPRDGTAIQAEIPGNGSDNVIAWRNIGLVDEQGNQCGGWVFVEDREPPESWTDGVCWAINEDGEPSTEPARWKPLPLKPNVAGEPPND